MFNKYIIQPNIFLWNGYKYATGYCYIRKSIKTYSTSIITYSSYMLFNR